MPHIICCEKKMMSTINGDEKYKYKDKYKDTRSFKKNINCFKYLYLPTFISKSFAHKSIQITLC